MYTFLFYVLRYATGCESEERRCLYKVGPTLLLFNDLHFPKPFLECVCTKKTKGLFGRGHPLLTSNYSRSKIYVTCIEVKRGDNIWGRKGEKVRTNCYVIYGRPQSFLNSQILFLYTFTSLSLFHCPRI